MHVVMRLPLKVASATSNFMIGVTAAASAGIYFQRGDIDPLVAGPVAVGVLCGASAGTVILRRIRGRALRLTFTAVLVVVAIQMLWRAL